MTWWGDPLNTWGGAMLQVHSDTRLSEIVAEMMWVNARMKGIPLTQELADEIRSKALEVEERDRRATAARGVTKDLRELLGATRKRLALRLAKRMVISKRDLHDLIGNCGTLNLSHHSKHHEFVPEQRRLTAEDNNAIFNLDGSRTPETLGKATGRVEQLFEEREHRSVHLFADSRERWHCFFLTFRDIAGEPATGKHHWEHGSHLHYVSHLFDPKLTKQAIWDALDERRHALPEVHIRFDDTPVPKDLARASCWTRSWGWRRR